MSAEPITEAKMQDIEQALLGTCNDDTELATEFNVDLDQMRKQMTERQCIERCPNCSWWVDLSEMTERGGVDMCDDCAND